MDKKVTDELENEVYKPRQHPGTDKAKVIALPSKLTTAIFKSLKGDLLSDYLIYQSSTLTISIPSIKKDTPLKAVYRDGQVLTRYLKGRHIPPDQMQVKYKRQIIADKLRETMDVSDEQKLKKYENKVDKVLKSQTYHWEPIVYDNYKSLQYLIGRSAQEYSTILRIFTEIQTRDPTFKPKSYFDFGSGVGTGLWAASNLWKDSIFEYFLVDTSRNMNDLADLILRNGEENKQIELRNVNFRQFFPASIEVSFNFH